MLTRTPVNTCADRLEPSAEGSRLIAVNNALQQFHHTHLEVDMIKHLAHPEMKRVDAELWNTGELFRRDETLIHQPRKSGT